jgi:hypothetical protein
VGGQGRRRGAVPAAASPGSIPWLSGEGLPVAVAWDAARGELRLRGRASVPAYARVLLGFLRDWYASAAADAREPVHVLELGAGHGRLSFLVLRELWERRAEWPALPGGAAPFTFVVTDVVPALLPFLRASNLYSLDAASAAMLPQGGGGANSA